MSKSASVSLEELARVSSQLARLSETVAVLAARAHGDEQEAAAHASKDARPRIDTGHASNAGHRNVNEHAGRRDDTDGRVASSHTLLRSHSQSGPSLTSPHAAARLHFINQNMPLLQRGIVVEASSDEEPVLRPAIYPDSHRPQARLDALEAARWDKVQMLDALKLDSFEGFYNLAMLILGFSMVYLILRNFREKGVQLQLADFACAELHRDVAAAAIVALLWYVLSLSVYVCVKLWIRKVLSWNAALYVYVAIQLLNVFGISAYLYATPMAPLPSAVLLMTALVLALKMHSYVATNFAMYNEHMVRYGRILADGEAAKPAPPPLVRAPSIKAVPQADAAEPGSKQQVRRRKRRAKKAGGADDAAPANEDADGPAAGSSMTEDGDDEDSGEDERLMQSGQASPLARPPSMRGGAMTAFAPATPLLQPVAAPAVAPESPLPAPSSTGTPVVDVDIISGTHAQKRRLIRAWPHNVTLKDYVLFLAVPTLVYEPKYPRTTRIRWTYVALKIAEMVACSAAQYVIFRQFMLPVLMHPTKPTHDGWHHELAATVFDMMKLGVPSLTVWILGFYALFHCFLNTVAEVLRFADREFYMSWWNSTNIASFWKSWNIPVHEWCLRHIFLELQHYARVNKSVAVFATFFFSAVFHELIFSVSFKTVRPWFFLGMLLQIPLMLVGRRFSNRRRGNYIVWLSLFMGQPLLEMLYFREYFQTHNNFFCAP